MGVRNSYSHSYWRTLTSVLLVAAVVVLSATIWQLSDKAKASSDDRVKWRYLISMMYLMTGLLVVTLGFIAMRCTRWISNQFKSPPKVAPTPLDSVWEEAGRRFELPPEDSDPDNEFPSEA